MPTTPGAPIDTARRVAALYDIHGNVRALEAVLDDVEAEGPDAIVVGGDVAAGPWPRETLDLLAGLRRPVVFVRGNADRELLERARGEGPSESPDVWDERTTWAASQLTGRHLELLESFVLSATVAIEGLGLTLFCHATPAADDVTITPLSSGARVRRHLGGTGADLIVCGHTHVQFAVSPAGVRLVNAGSVGMPYEGRTGAFWTMLGPEVSFRHSEYDVAAAADEIAGGPFPDARAFAHEFVLSSYPPDETLQVFESQAIEREETGRPSD